MKSCTLFAIVGCVLNLLSHIWWAVFSIVGYEELGDVFAIMQSVTGVFGFVWSISMIVFFAMLFSRQK